MSNEGIACVSPFWRSGFAQFYRIRCDRRARAVVELGGAVDRMTRDVFGRSLGIIVCRIHDTEGDVAAAAERVELRELLDGSMRRDAEDTRRIHDQHVHPR